MSLTNKEYIFESIRERDVDFMLVEELRCSERFTRWFLNAIGAEDGLEPVWIAKPAHVGHSVRTDRGAGAGESDLELLFDANAIDGERRLAVFIENKIDHRLGPKQAERYRKRAYAALESRKCSQAVTVLVAPVGYRCVGADLFDSRVTYQDIMSYFEDTASVQEMDANHLEAARMRHRCELLQHAMERWRRGWQHIEDEITTKSYDAYRTRARMEAPSLGALRRESKVKRSPFVYFKSALLRGSDHPWEITRSTPWDIMHKPKTGTHGRPYEKTHEEVQINLRGWAKDGRAAIPLIERLLESGMKVRRANKSLAVSIATPMVDLAKPLEPQLAAVDEGLRAALRLQAWYEKNLVRLVEIARLIVSSGGPR